MSSEITQYYIFRSKGDDLIRTNLNGGDEHTYSNISGGNIVLFSILQTDNSLLIFTVTGGNRNYLKAFDENDLSNPIWTKSISRISDITSYSFDNNGTTEYRVVITTGWYGYNGTDYIFNATNGSQLNSFSVGHAGLALDHYFDSEANKVYILFAHANGLIIRDGSDPTNILKPSSGKLNPNSSNEWDTGVSHLIHNDGSEEIVYVVTSQNVAGDWIDYRYDVWRADDNSTQPIARVENKHAPESGADLSHSTAAAKTTNKLLGFGSGRYNYIDIFDLTDGTLFKDPSDPSDESKNLKIEISSHTWQKGQIDAHSNSDGSVTLVAALNNHDFYIWNIVDNADDIIVNEIQHIQASGSEVNYTKIFGITSSNTAPNINNVYITPQTPLVGDILTANATTSDVDGQNITLSYKWIKNDVELNNETNSTLDTTNNFSMGDQISVIITPNDGIVDGDSQETIKVVLNTTPSIINPWSAITPTYPTNQDTLSVSFTTFDLDGQSVTVSHQWLRNDIDINGETSTSLDISSFNVGDRIRVRGIPNDGLQDGNPALSNEVTIIAQTYTVQNDIIDLNIFNDQYITLTSDPNDANIYYTIDGNDPDNSSTLYTGPFRIAQTGEIQLKYVAIGNSATTSQIYLRNYSITDWIEHNDFDIDNTRKSVFKTWRNNASRITNRLDWSTFNVQNQKNTWRKMKSILRKAKKLNEINNGDLISFIPESRTTQISAKIIYDEDALNTPNNINELSEYTIMSGDNFYIPIDDEENVDNAYWVKLISGGNSKNIKFEYTSGNYLYNILDENLTITETYQIDEETVLTIGDSTFKLFTGGVGGENEESSADIDNIDDILTIFNCAIQKIQVECSRLDALNKILCLKECMLKVNKKK